MRGRGCVLPQGDRRGWVERRPALAAARIARTTDESRCKNGVAACPKFPACALRQRWSANRPREMTWTAAELPGVFLDVLFDDTARGYTTAMVRMTPGTYYPSHKHAGVEERYLLEGDYFQRTAQRASGRTACDSGPTRPDIFCCGSEGRRNSLRMFQPPESRGAHAVSNG